tara:strand:+ start:784 stop:1158 length:375 start_codon:yes stop_codon:yes gene_type:complete
MTLQESRQEFFDRWDAMQIENRKSYLKSFESLDDNKVVCTEWWLKSEDYDTKTWSHDKGETGGYVHDFKSIRRSIITIGTEKQEALLMLDLNVQIKDSWNTELTEEYNQLYIDNNNQALLINLK